MFQLGLLGTLFVVAMLTSTVSMSNAEELVGRASVIDADTIEIHGQRDACTASTHPKVARTASCLTVRPGVAVKRVRWRCRTFLHKRL